MTCNIHNPRLDKPCPWCAWAASNDQSLIDAASRRAARIADPEYATKSGNLQITPGGNSFSWLAKAKECQSRIRVGCGCSGTWQCRVREMAAVSLEDCRKCIASRDTG